MDAIRTVLCPVDFSAATERQLHFAVDVCRLCSARLVLHHNLEVSGPGAAVGWMRIQDHPGPQLEDTAENRLKHLLAKIPEGIAGQASLTHGPPSSTILRVAELVQADLLILTNHGTFRDDHASITEQALERSNCGVLVLHETGVDHSAPRFSADGASQIVLVPATFSGTSTPAVEFAFKLARKLPLEIHLLHIEPARKSCGEPASAAAQQERARLQSLVPADLEDRVHVQIRQGDPAHEIAAAAERLSAVLIVMGEHARTSLRRWFTRDTGRAVLHRAHCPVWYVPTSPANTGTRATQVTGEAGDAAG